MSHNRTQGQAPSLLSRLISPFQTGSQQCETRTTNETRTEEVDPESDIVRQKLTASAQVDERLAWEKQQEDSEKAELRLQLDRSHDNIKNLQEDLEECKAQIFKLQPTETVPDTEISMQYQDFCIYLADWVDRQFFSVDGVLEPIYFSGWNGRSFRLLRKYMGKDEERDIVLSFPNAEGAMIRYLMHRHLHENLIAGQTYHICLSEQDNNLLASIEKGMRSLEPRRETIDSWKADVKAVLAANPNLRKGLAERNREITASISNLFTALLPIEEKTIWNDRDCQELVQLAASFKVSIDKCPTSYVSEYDFLPNDPYVQRELRPDDFARYNVLDAETGQTVRSPKKLEVDSEGRIGRKMCVIQPGLKRCNADSVEKIVLVKATI